VVLRLLAERLARLRDLTVGALTHPQSRVADFYRELGDLFGVTLQPHNRWNAGTGSRCCGSGGWRIWRARSCARCS
jgi:hypothetical protein